jgi:superfamily I DNA and/or RNA helicase
VEGSGEDKWCEAEGVAALGLLQTLVRAGIEPDLYIVTPFVIVAERLRELFRGDGVLRSWFGEDEAWKWVAERIGTVHTVQGREAEAVILVLGAPNPSQTGARGWAGGRPNLLNVAMTRAKEALYVIGNRTLWRQAGNFGVLDAHLG